MQENKRVATDGSLNSSPGRGELQAVNVADGSPFISSALPDWLMEQEEGGMTQVSSLPKRGLISMKGLIRVFSEAMQFYLKIPAVLN